MLELNIKDVDIRTSRDVLKDVEKIVDELYEEYELEENMPRKHLNVAVVKWDSCHGKAIYNTVLLNPLNDKRLSERITSYGHHTIVINSRIKDYDDLKDTVIHEVAHVLLYNEDNKPHGHDRHWKYLTKALGGTPERTSSKYPGGEYKYEVVCENGCYHKKTNRMTKVVKNPETRICGKCKGELKRIK